MTEKSEKKEEGGFEIKWDILKKFVGMTGGIGVWILINISILIQKFLQFHRDYTVKSIHKEAKHSDSPSEYA